MIGYPAISRDILRYFAISCTLLYQANAEIHRPGHCACRLHKLQICNSARRDKTALFDAGAGRCGFKFPSRLHIFRHIFFNNRPKCRAVIHMDQVGKLVYHNIIDGVCRIFHYSIWKIERSGATAAAESLFRSVYLHAFGFYPHFFTETAHSFRYHRFCKTSHTFHIAGCPVFGVCQVSLQYRWRFFQGTHERRCRLYCTAFLQLPNCHLWQLQKYFFSPTVSVRNTPFFRQDQFFSLYFNHRLWASRRVPLASRGIPWASRGVENTFIFSVP